MQFLSPSSPIPFLSTSLPHELQTHTNSLVVMGRGLGYRRMLVELLRTLAGTSTSPAASKVVLVLNASKDAEWIMDSCDEFHIRPVKIEKETVSRRKDTYEKGGIFIPTARTLVMDLLSKSLPVNSIHTLLILDAEKVDDTSNDAFCVRLVRLNSPTCHIQAFSTRPERFSTLIKLSQRMRLLRVSHLSLWPRNREEVKRDLNPTAPRISESIQPMSPLMFDIQSCLIQLVEFCVAGLQRFPDVNITGLTVETNLFRAFDVQLRTQLAQTWNRVPFKAKCFLRDLNVLRKLLWSLLTMDAVTFYGRLLEVKEDNESRDNVEGRADWLLHDTADTLFQKARARIWTFDNGTLRISLEPDCKILALKRILDNIAVEQTKTRDKMGISLEMLGGSDIVVVVPDEDAKFQVMAELCDFALTPEMEQDKPWMTRLENKFWRFLEKHVHNRDRPTFRVSQQEHAALKLECANLSERRSGKTDAPGSTMMEFDKDSATATAAQTAAYLSVRCMTREEQVAVCTWREMSHGFLDRARPRFVISYSADHAMIREIEVMQATFPKWPLSFYMLYYKDSVEEQRFFASIKREREAFSMLIREKSQLSFPSTAPNESDGLRHDSTIIKDVIKKDVATGAMVVLKELGGNATTGNAPINKIVVDSRELPSSLPFWLHMADFVIDLRTLEVGDYVLSPKICVERKSPNDLLGSLKRESRLLIQVPNMLRHYERTVLLIEYPDNAPFTSLEAYVDEKKTIDLEGLMSKLTMLLLEYPDLKVLWSMTPRSTVDLFRELQRNQPPPDGDRAEEKEKTQASIGFDEADHVNLTAMNILKRLPGVTDENIFKLARGCKTLAGLAAMSTGELAQLMGSTIGAQKLFEFLRKNQMVDHV